MLQIRNGGIGTITRRVGLIALGCLWALTGCQQKTPTEKLDEATQMFREGDILGAQMKYQEITEKHAEAPEARTARLGLAMTHEADRNFDQARQEYAAVVAAAGGAGTPEGFNAASRLVATWVNEQKPDKALEESISTSATLRDAPQEARDAWALQTMDLFRMNKQNDAATSLGWAVLATPPSAMERHMPALDRIGQMRAEAGNPVEAARAYDRYLQIYPETPLRGMVLFGKAFYLRTAGDDAATSAALEETRAQFQKDFDQALGADQKVQAVMHMARLEEFKGNRDAARALLEQLLNRDNYPLAQHRQAGQMAIVQLEMGRQQPRAAIAVLEEVARENPASEIESNARRMIQGILQQMEQTTATTATTGTLGTIATPPAGDSATTGSTGPADNPAPPATSAAPTTDTP